MVAGGVASLVRDGDSTQTTTSGYPGGPTSTALEGARAGGPLAGDVLVTGPEPSTVGPSRDSSSATFVNGHRVLSADERALHVANRLTWGATPQLRDEIRAVGIEAFVNQQLAPATIDDGAVDGSLSQFRTLSMSALEVQRFRDGLLGLGRHPAFHNVRELRHALLLRATSSRRQLYEVMVDFWTNHLNVFAFATPEIGAAKTVEDREVIRPHALGRFADLLNASAHSPAMLLYLSNAESVAGNPNENYARELLELHTLGAGAFSEGDVKSCATLFTGWGVNRESLTFEFSGSRHDASAVSVAGWSSSPVTGEADGIALLDHLAHHPATATNLATKLCQRFVADDPPESVVAGAADAYLAHDTAIAPVLAYIFSTDEFYDSFGQRFRRPLEFYVASLRTCGVQVPAGLDTENADEAARYSEAVLNTMGMLPFSCTTPNGYSERTSRWIGTGSVLARWNHARLLGNNAAPGLAWDRGGFLDARAYPTWGDLADGVLARTLSGLVPAGRRDAMLAFIDEAADAPAPATAWETSVPKLVWLALATAEMSQR